MNISNIYLYVIFIFSFLPYNFVLIETRDTQPIVFIIVLCTIPMYVIASNFFFPKKYLKIIFITLILLCVHIILILINRLHLEIVNELDYVTLIRMLGGLFSLLLIPITIAILPKIKINFLFFMIFFLWLFVALMQLYFDKGFASDLVSLTRFGHGNRGVGSLAPEPDLYGRVIMAFMVLGYILYLEKNIKLYSFSIVIFFSIYQVFFLSKAATSSILVTLIVFLIFISIIPKKLFWPLTIFFILSFSTLFISGMYYFSEYRVFSVIFSAIENPEYLFSQGGFMARFYNLPLSFFVGMIETNGLGAGVVFPRSEFDLNHKLFSYFNTFISTTAHGGLVGLIYTFGLIGLIFVIGFYYLLIKVIKNITRSKDIKFYSLLLIFTILFLFDMSLSDPSRLFLLGYIFQKYNEGYIENDTKK